MKNRKVYAYYPKSKYLTHGKKYEIQWIGSKDRDIAVRNDKGIIRPYKADNFTSYVIEIDTNSNKSKIK